MRVFFAVPLPEALEQRLAEYQGRLRRTALAASWPEARGLHVTLAFLGEREPAVVPGLLAAAARAAAGQAPFPFRTGALGGFPRDPAARILWLGVAEQPALGALAEAVRRELREAGEAFDDKPFRAHLTLARFRERQDVTRFDPLGDPLVFEVRDVVLFQSVRAPSGSHYLTLGRVPLLG